MDGRAFPLFGARGTMLAEIDIKRRDGIAHVVLNRPSVRNAVTLAMWRELAEIFSRFAADRDLRAVVLTGKGKDFSVGAAISGYCLGGGCHLALACDFRFVDRTATLGIPSAKLSIVYGVRSVQRLSALVGITNAKRILYSGDRYSAEQAKSMGL